MKVFKYNFEKETVLLDSSAQEISNRFWCRSCARRSRITPQWIKLIIFNKWSWPVVLRKSLRGVTPHAISLEMVPQIHEARLAFCRSRLKLASVMSCGCQSQRKPWVDNFLISIHFTIVRGTICSRPFDIGAYILLSLELLDPTRVCLQIGRASCRERV